MSLAKLAIDQSEKEEQSKAFRYGKNGALLGAGAGTLAGLVNHVNTYDALHPNAGVNYRSLSADALKNIVRRTPGPIVGLGLAGAGIGAIGDQLSDRKNEDE